MESGGEARRTTPGGVWRLIVHDAEDPHWNMAVDSALHEAVENALAPPTLRFYRWDRSAVTIGLHQDAARSVDLRACEELGVPVVRRPTGGRGILHGSDQTLSVAAPYARLGPDSGSICGSYALLHAGIRRALAELGVPVSPGRERRSSSGVGDCFALRTPADLVTADGHKVLGSAQRRGRVALLQQTSLLHLPPMQDPTRLFLGRPASFAYPLAEVDADELVGALVCGFSQSLGIRLEPDTLSQWEVERAAVVAAALWSRPIVDRSPAV